MDNDLNYLSILVPAYKPGESLVTLCDDLMRQGFNSVVVVDDGSGEEFSGIFRRVKELGCRVLTHSANMGKGTALKTGFNDILANSTGVKAVVTADADGQHLVKDIINVGRITLEMDDSIVIGGRAFKGNVPLKSRMGNAITRNVFRFVSGQKIHDTQTGLRGFPISSLPKIIPLSGDRYEYEMNMLLEASRLDLKLKEIEIETVYLNDNESSHFNAVKDSWRIYKLIIMFGASSIISFVVDYLVFISIASIFPSTADKSATIVWIPLLGARLISSTVNFTINRNVIFAKGRKGNLRRQIIGYYILAAFVLTGNIAITSLCKNLGIDLSLSYFISLVMFIVSFPIQKRVIFK